MEMNNLLLYALKNHLIWDILELNFMQDVVLKYYDAFIW